MIILKLGGSVLTNKAKSSSFQHDTMKNLAHAIQPVAHDIILVHGAGSYGHILAKKYALNQGYKQKDQLLGFSQTHAMVQELNTLVLKALHKASIPAVSLPPHALVTLNNHHMHTFDTTSFQSYLKAGFTPVTFGDVVLDTKLGFSICSGDLLIEHLAKEFKPEKVVFVMDEDGIYTSNPKTDSSATLVKKTTVDKLNNLTTQADAHADVTSGMKGKINTIQQIAHHGIDTFVVNGNKPDCLTALLQGEDTICTHIKGAKQ